jgi:hypothetical protein
LNVFSASDATGQGAKPSDREKFTELARELLALRIDAREHLAYPLDERCDFPDLGLNPPSSGCRRSPGGPFTAAGAGAHIFADLSADHRDERGSRVIGPMRRAKPQRRYRGLAAIARIDIICALAS